MVTPKFKTLSVPAPVGGLNDRDSIAAMRPTDAVILENWWVYPSYLQIRNGSINHVTGFASPVETLVEYLPESGASTLFAAAGNSIFNVTTAGALGAAVQTGLTNARWQDANITTPGGSFLYLVNGSDAPRLWNGTTWTTVTGASSPAITGVTTTDLVHACVYKNRLFFVVKNSMELVYLPVLSVGGVAAFIDLGSVFRLGGSIQAAYTWTIDAGSGADDHLVVISTNGEVAVYSGTDPSSAANWRLIGVFTMGRPLGRRCGIKYGGDLAINTMEGVFPLGKGLLSSSVDRRVSLTDKIQNLVSQAANANPLLFGWQLCLYPDQNMLILNVPQSVGNNYQFAQNTITGAWTKFTGWDANVWLNASTGLYYADSSKVYKAWIGDLDVSVPIQADVLPAFVNFGSQTFNKFVTMVRPYLLTSGAPSIVYGLNIDYFPKNVTDALSYTAPTGMVWGSMVWGSMVWGSGLTNISDWNTVGSVANSAALRMKAQNNGAMLQLSSIDYVYQPGRGVL